MTEIANVDPTRRLLGWRGRTAALVLAMCLFAMLGIATLLRPAAAGLGTHQQLGLPPCSLRVLFGIRCPACGMTTSWSHYVRGQWISSIQVNPGGFMLALLASATCVAAMRVGVTGCHVSPYHVNWVTFWLMGALSVTVVDWIMRMI